MHRLIFGAGAQTIRSVPQRDGRALVVASANYKLLDLRYSADNDAQVLASGAAAVDSVSTTLSAAAGKGTADPRALTVASAAGIAAGRRYLLTSGGRSELVKVEAISGTTLRLAATLPAYFAGGATFSGVELAATVGVDVTGDEVYLRSHVLAVRWEPTGILAFQEQIFLERVAPSPQISAEAVLELDASLPSYCRDGFTVAAALALAQEDFQVDMLAAGLEDSRVLAGPIGRNAVKYLSAWHILKDSTDASAVSRAERYHARYQELLANLLAGKDKAKVAHVDADNAKKPEDIKSLFDVAW